MSICVGCASWAADSQQARGAEEMFAATQAASCCCAPLTRLKFPMVMRCNGERLVLAIFRVERVERRSQRLRRPPKASWSGGVEQAQTVDQRQPRSQLAAGCVFCKARGRGTGRRDSSTREETHSVEDNAWGRLATDDI